MTNTIYQIASLLTGASSKLTTIIHYEQFHREVNHNPSFVVKSAQAVLKDLTQVEENASKLESEDRGSISKEVLKELNGINHAYQMLEMNYTELKEIPVKEKVTGLEYLFS